MVGNLFVLPFLAEYTRAPAVAETHHRRHHQTALLIDRVLFIKCERIQMKIYKSARHCLTCVMLSSRRPDRNVHVTRNTVRPLFLPSPLECPVRMEQLYAILFVVFFSFELLAVDAAAAWHTLP